MIIMKKQGFAIVELLTIFVIIAVPNVLSMFNNAKKDTFTTETKDMVRIAQQQFLSNFGKWNYYAMEGSKDKNSKIIDTKECTVSSGPEVITDSDGKVINVKKYCKIKRKSTNLKSFIVTFDASKAEIKTIYSLDESYHYDFDSSIDGTFDIIKIK